MNFNRWITLEVIGGTLTFFLFILTFAWYDSLNSQLLNLEIAGMRYDIATNESLLTKTVYRVEKNNSLLATSVNSLFLSFKNNMVNLDMSHSERDKYLNNIRPYTAKYVSFDGLKLYDEFLEKYHKSVNSFLSEEYDIRIGEIKKSKNNCKYSIITLVVAITGLGIILKIKTRDSFH